VKKNQCTKQQHCQCPPPKHVTIDNKTNKVERKKTWFTNETTTTPCVHNTCIPIVKIYVKQSIYVLCRFQQQRTKPPFYMKFDAKKFQPFENHFKLHVIFSSFRKYLVDRFKCKQIITLQTIGPKGYNNLQGNPSSNYKYWSWFFKNVTKCFNRKTI
jgi:hypothetical protein